MMGFFPRCFFVPTGKLNGVKPKGTHSGFPTVFAAGGLWPCIIAGDLAVLQWGTWKDSSYIYQIYLDLSSGTGGFYLDFA